MIYVIGFYYSFIYLIREVYIPGKKNVTKRKSFNYKKSFYSIWSLDRNWLEQMLDFTGALILNMVTQI